MKQDLINDIIVKMMDKLDESGITQLKMSLYMVLNNFDVVAKKQELVNYDDNNFVILRKYAEAKMASGKTKATVKMYTNQLRLALTSINKDVKEITEDDIRCFLYKYQIEKGNKNVTIRNMRAYLNGFFNWLRKNRYIKENPMDLVEPIKQDYTIKNPYNDEEIVRIKDSCETKRDRAIVDLLDASMMRIGELVGLNRSDIEFSERECIVYGKGRKERIAYFNGEAKLHMEDYINSRTDKNPALFVTYCGKNRLSDDGIRSMLKKIGKKANVNKVHPHRFRRTGATRCLSAGMPIEELQVLMGHNDIKTTLIYGKIDKRKVKYKYDAICSW